jgi:type 1 glutamine amidotransferase
MKRLTALLFFFVAVATSISFAADTRKKLVMLIAEQEYETAKTLPEFAKQLAKDFRVVVVSGSTAAGESSFDRINEIADADVLLVSVRRRPPLKDQLDVIKRHVQAGKPVVGIRTASHAFALAKGQTLTPGTADWPQFDAEVLGGNYGNHHAKGAAAHVVLSNPAAAKHPILAGVAVPFDSESTLYRNTPLRAGAQPLLTASIPNQPPEPVAWTFTRADGGRTFYTSLGSPSDFKNDSFTRLLRNGIAWAAKTK